MGDFFAQLRRRHIFRVAIAYAVVAWVLLQLFNNLTPIMTLPEWAGTLVLVLLVGGFPVAILFAWIHQLAPAVATQPALTSERKPPLGSVADSKGSSVTDLRAVHAPTPISIAVLPFANLSGDTAQEFFSDGMTEEITAALAKVPNLRVVGRTSAFQFKGQNKDLRAIGEALSATHLIEGSVRKEGNQLRITAQLIKAVDGTHLWAETFGRELKGVFAVQEEIAQAIAASLELPLGLKQGETLVRSRRIDPDSYQQYLRAKALVRARGLNSLTAAAALLERVVARDRDYTPAWALLALAYVLMPNYHPSVVGGAVSEVRDLIDASMSKADSAARRAIELDARNADGHAALGYVQVIRSSFVQGDEHFLKALELDANNPDALHFCSLALAALGHLTKALELRRRLLALEPFVPNFNINTAYVLWTTGHAEEALTVMKDVPRDFAFGQWFRAWIAACLGRYDDAADAILSIRGDTVLQKAIQDAADLMRSAPAAARSPQTLPRLGMLGFIYLHVGAETRVFEFFEDNVEAGYSMPGTIGFLWHSSYASLRQSERFKAFARKAGLAEYWRAKGWPDFCRPTGDGFVCE